jgi:hypothetical protein
MPSRDTFFSAKISSKKGDSMSGMPGTGFTLGIESSLEARLL